MRLREKNLAVALMLCTVALSGCRKDMVRPRPASESFADRPDRALIVGQFKLSLSGLSTDELTMVPHRILAGKDKEEFQELIPTDGRVFMIWVTPGVFCFGQPMYGDPPKVLGGAAPCAEIPSARKAYYVGSVTWGVAKSASNVVAIVEIKNELETVSANSYLRGISLEDAVVAQTPKPEAAAAKYTPK